MSWYDDIGAGHPDLLDAIVGAMPEPFFVLDRDGRYVAVLGGVDNPNYHDGRPLIGRRIHEVMSSHLADAFVARINDSLDTGSVVSYEYELASDDVDGVEERATVPNRLWFEAHVAPLPRVDGRPDLVVWMIFNITDSKAAMLRLEEQQVELERLARTDPLTGLLNRRSFFADAYRELQWVRRTGAPAALVQFDLDHFKDVNDTWGHSVGDSVLRAIGALLLGRGRATDVAARIGGEEFALVVRDSSLDDARRLATRLAGEIERMLVPHPDGSVQVTASFGVTEMRAADGDPEDALKRADAAMYRAKEAGRNQVASDPAT